jgi:hypothetical protein
MYLDMYNYMLAEVSIFGTVPFLACWHCLWAASVMTSSANLFSRSAVLFTEGGRGGSVTYVMLMAVGRRFSTQVLFSNIFSALLSTSAALLSLGGSMSCKMAMTGYGYNGGIQTGTMFYFDLPACCFSRDPLPPTLHADFLTLLPFFFLFLVSELTRCIRMFIPELLCSLVGQSNPIPSAPYHCVYETTIQYTSSSPFVSQLETSVNNHGSTQKPPIHSIRDVCI